MARPTAAAGAWRPAPGEPAEETLRRPGAYMPRGTMVEPFYDRRPIVGLSGPGGTGKSRTWLEKVHLLMEKYPGARGLISRKTRESLGEAALFTYEEKVLPPGHPCLQGPQRSHRQKYVYPNGSEIVVVGLDKPQKLMSMEIDIAYVQEATECTAGDIQDISTRLRNGVIPYNQLLFDCNPDKPLHWIHQAYKRGEFPLYFTLHEDNPRLWEQAPPQVTQRCQAFPELSRDGRVGRWTTEGVAYIAKLMALKGARRARLFEGLWVQAEGVVYTNWEANDTRPDGRLVRGGLVDRPVPLQGRRVWALDFGFTHPLVMQRWAVDGDGRMVMYAELYRTRTLVSDAAVAFLADAGWRWDPVAGAHYPTDEFLKDGREPEPLPEAVVCDHDAEGRATFEASTGLSTEPAYKTIADGIQNMENRLGVAADGRRRMSFSRTALIHDPDPNLAGQMKPQRTTEEFDGYVWAEDKGTGKKGEVPLGQDDHGMDTSRYAAAYVDCLRDEFKAGDVPEAALVSPMVVGVQNARGRAAEQGAGGGSAGKIYNPKDGTGGGENGGGSIIEVRAGWPGQGALWARASGRRSSRRGRQGP